MWYISFLIWAGILFPLSSTFSSEYNCYSKIGKDVKGMDVRRSLGGIVGMGWNDITNEETLPVLSITYNNCRTVPDGDFLIPDNVVALPVKISHIVESADSFETFSQFKHSVGVGMETHASGGISKFSVSGSLSVETKIGKEHMEQHGRTGFSNKLEYHAFNLIANENNGFDESFNNRLIEVAEALKAGNPLLAQYEAESIIGDYGTHVTNRAIAGAKMSIFGFTTFSNESEKNDFMLKVSAKFDAQFMVGSAGGKVSTNIDNSDAHGTTESATHTYIFAHGGADIKNLLNNPGHKMSADSVVGLKRNGIPIYSLIHKGSLADTYGTTMIEIVQDLIYNATQEFYRHNTIPGCTDSSKQNYFLKANVEDGTCKEDTCSITVINPRPANQKRPNGPCTLVNGKCVYNIRPVKGDAPRQPSRVYNVRPGSNEKPKANNVRPGSKADRVQHSKCKAPIMGGVIQECEYISSFSKAHANLTHGNQCNEYEHPNQLTKNYSCPFGFEKKIAGVFHATFKHRLDTVKNETCVTTTCHATTKTHEIIDKIKVTAYWCSHIVPNVTSGLKVSNFSLQDALANLFGATQPAANDRAEDTTGLCRELETADNEMLASWKQMGFPREMLEVVKKSKVIVPKSCHQNKTSTSETPPPRSVVNVSLKLAYTGEGMVFGGIFEKDNIFSDNRRCEAGFQEYPFFHNLKICLAIPDDQTVEKSIEFGGMISCHDVTQECPKGLSKYLATTINGCSYYYCASIAKKSTITTLPSLKKPPYVDRDLAMSKTRFSYQHEIEKLEENENGDVVVVTP